MNTRSTTPTGYLYRDARRAWRWRIVAANGRKLANGGESYRRRIDCFRMLSRWRRAGRVRLMAHIAVTDEYLRQLRGLLLWVTG